MKKDKPIEVIFKQAKGISQEEMEKKLYDAYEILLEEVLKNETP